MYDHTLLSGGNNWWMHLNTINCLSCTTLISSNSQHHMTCQSDATCITPASTPNISQLCTCLSFLDDIPHFRLIILSSVQVFSQPDLTTIYHKRLFTQLTFPFSFNQKPSIVKTYENLQNHFQDMNLLTAFMDYGTVFLDFFCSSVCAFVSFSLTFCLVPYRRLLYLVPCLRGEQLSSTQCWSGAIETFGPMHIPIATKGHENLFVALANHTLCSSAGCMRCAPKMGYLICILAQHSPKKWHEVCSCSPHAEHSGSSKIFITVKCLLNVYMASK